MFKGNPLNTTGCPDMEALGGNVTFLWNKTGIPQDEKIWKMPNQGKIDWVEKGATFTIERSGDSPTANSVFYMLFGRLEIVMKVATGTGIISSAILQSEALDEIDWEFIGDRKSILTNYFGKGDTSTYDRGKDFDLDFAPQDDFHNYTINWTKERIEWLVDGKSLRNLTFEEAKNGTRYPQTPMNIRLGAWAAGDPSKNDPGVVEWAGGQTNFAKGPYTMTIKQVYAQDYTSAAKYSWENMDSTGDWEKVKVIEYVLPFFLSCQSARDLRLTKCRGKSEVLEEIQSPHGVRNRFSALSSGAKAGIIIGSVSAFVIAVLGLLFYCIKQRRAGKKEHEALLAEEQKEAAELSEYKSQMQAGRFAVGSGHA
jgi:hypothetical protein